MRHAPVGLYDALNVCTVLEFSALYMSNVICVRLVPNLRILASRKATWLTRSERCADVGSSASVTFAALPASGRPRSGATVAFGTTQLACIGCPGMFCSVAAT